MRRCLATGLFVLWLSAFGIRVEGRKIDGTKNFKIDPNRPWVYLQFDHIGSGMPRSENEPATRIWLRLTNNCRVPIIVRTFGVPKGGPPDEQGVMDEVVANPSISILGGIIVHPSTALPRPPAGDETQSSAQANQMPEGYWSEVSSSQSIPPGRAVLFSVPINHVSNTWHFEIPFEFDLPNTRGKTLRDPKVGGIPSMVITYTIGDLPPEHRNELENIAAVTWDYN